MPFTPNSCRTEIIDVFFLNENLKTNIFLMKDLFLHVLCAWSIYMGISLLKFQNKNVLVLLILSEEFVFARTFIFNSQVKQINTITFLFSTLLLNYTAFVK